LKKSILVPVFNDALRVPSLLRALTTATRKTKDFEILFIDNGSTDGSHEMLETARLPHSRVLRESRVGFAEPLNSGIAEAAGDILLFLDAGSMPDANWVTEMEKALQGCDVAVGNTVSLAPKKATPYSRVATKLFEKHSERTAHARGHALPWGPAGNLGAHRSIVEKAGPFSTEASSAFDIDWCWRTLLAGGILSYAGKAKVARLCPTEKRALLEEFERYGLGEAWLHRTYAFLLSPDDRHADPLLAGVDAFSRLRHQSNASGVKTLAPTLDEVSAAFSGGVRIGYERPHRECPLERSIPAFALSWSNGPNSTTVFVPGKGLAALGGKQRQLFSAIKGGMSEHDLVHLFMKLFKANHHEAEHEVAEFRSSLTP
jgi:GT2 family glycosyltransferase